MLIHLLYILTKEKSSSVTGIRLIGCIIELRI
jgi:hypothetical protein